MEQADKRKHSRVETKNLVHYVSISKDGRIVSRSMLRSLNVSRSGLLLETEHPIEEEHALLMDANPDSEMIEIKGQPIYCRETRS